MKCLNPLFHDFRFISKFADQIFHESLLRARKERSRSERDAASIGGISTFNEPPVGHPQSAAGAGYVSLEEITDSPATVGER